MKNALQVQHRGDVVENLRGDGLQRRLHSEMQSAVRSRGYKDDIFLENPNMEFTYKGCSAELATNTLNVRR
jgi:hypothetical protein